MRTVEQWKTLFTIINSEHPESCVPFENKSYYAEQISNVCVYDGEDVSYEECMEIAGKLSGGSS